MRGELRAEPVTPGGDLLGEGPLWDPTGERLLWVDISAPALRTYHPATGATGTLPVGGTISAVVPRAAGGLLAVAADGFAELDEASGALVMLRTLRSEPAGNRMNDAACDPAGRLWAGSMASDLRTPAGSLYRLDPDLTVHTVLRPVTISNGIGWSPAGRQMYYIDSRTQRVDVFDFEPDTGVASGRRPFVAIPERDGLPDGLAVDAEGGVWVALHGSGTIRRFGPDGRSSITVRVPVRAVTSCAFGGPGRTDLYITTSAELEPDNGEPGSGPAGALFRARTGTEGAPVAPFAG
jgi:sugar lactone lactonase YvrE